MAAGAWLRRWGWGWGQRCPGRPGLPGPGPGPTALLHFLLLLGPVAADITDGNSEHLKREHSLIKPYQGEACSRKKSRVRTRDRSALEEGIPFLWSGAALSVSGAAFWAPVYVRLCLQGSVPVPCRSGTSKAAQC